MRWKIVAHRLTPLTVAALALAGCGVPDDRLFVPDPREPEEIEPGLWRLTANAGPDIVSGWDATGRRVMYRSQGGPGFGPGWRMLSVAADGGEAREEAGVYREASRTPVGRLRVHEDFRVLTLWREPVAGVHSCLGCPAPPTVIGISILRLEATDGVALSALPRRSLELPNNVHPSDCDHRLRITPAEEQIRRWGVDPHGPAVVPDGTVAVYSDGETLWRFDLSDPSAAAESLGVGAFPAVSPDGRLLAAAVPAVADSTGSTCVAGLCPCVQQMTTYSGTSWRVVVRDLETWAELVQAPGLEPVFHPVDVTVIVRRFDALYRMDVGSGVADSIPGTSGGFAPAISPDGARLAFSTTLFGNADVYVVELER